MRKLRSFLFSLAFLIWSCLCSLLLLWTLLLPRNYARAIIRVVYFRAVHLLERIILGLDFRVTGRENLPLSGSYIIAAKHQSAYETLKIHLMFPTANIVIKKELADIPLWGWLCVKAGGIPIDRSDGQQSMKKILAHLEPVKRHAEPLLIYPQGTRVPTGATPEQYPYKPGVALMAKAAGLPIIPMRCDSGLYWPKKGWTNKRGGIVRFDIRPALTGGTAKEIMAGLETELEQPPEG